MYDQEIKLYFGGDLANLYELGWISIDLSQILEFAELVEGDEYDRAEKYFGENARPFNRYVSLTEGRRKRPEIVDVRKGSIELVIAGASVAAAIIMPLVQVAVQRYFAERNEVVDFEFSPQDQGLKKIMEAYERGDYGRGVDGLNALMSVLQQRNYNVSALANNTYLVEHVVEKYAQRIVRTIKKNM